MLIFGRHNLGTVKGWRKFRKKDVVLAVRIEEPFVVETKEGDVVCWDGWLAVNGSGVPYPIAVEDMQLYEEVEDD